MNTLLWIFFAVLIAVVFWTITREIAAESKKYRRRSNRH
jgi:hypothetical protein